MIKLRSNVRLTLDVVTLLADLARDAGNRRTMGTSSHESLTSFIVRAARQLRFTFPADEISKLLAVPTFLGSPSHIADPFWNDGSDLMLEEIELRLKAAADSLSYERGRWVDCGHIVVPDTSIFIQVLDKPVADVDWRALVGYHSTTSVTVVLPVTVLDELDALKRDGDRQRARMALREIAELTKSGVSGAIDSTIRIEILVPDIDHVPLPINDNEIIDQAIQLRNTIEKGSKVRLATGDTGMAMRARMLGLEVEHHDSSDRQTLKTRA